MLETCSEQAETCAGTVLKISYCLGIILAFSPQNMFTASRNSCCFFLSTEGLLSGKLLKICSRQAQINAEVLLEASNAGKWFAIRLQKILFRDYGSFFSSKYAHSKQKFVLLLCSFSLRGCQKNCWRQTERRSCARLLMLEGVCFLENLTENMLRTSGKQC